MQYSEWSNLLKADYRGMCHCPVHRDEKRSLKISDGKDKLLMQCFAGCSTESIVEAVGKQMSDLFYDNGTDDNSDTHWMRYVENRMKKQIESVYHHVDMDGNYICTKIRFHPKDFRYGILKDNRFTFGLGGKKRKSIKAFYCKDLNKLKEAVANGDVVYVVEGEKDVDRLYSHSLIGLTCGGVNDWCKGVADILKGAFVVVLADNDQPGIKVARQIEKDLRGIAKTVKVVIPTPDIPHGDVSDYLKDHTVEELQSLISVTKKGASLPEVKDRPLTESQAIELSQSQELDLQVTEKGKVMASFINYCQILEKDSYLSEKPCFNLMSNRPMIKDVFWNLGLHDIEDEDYLEIRRYISKVYGIHNKNDIVQAVNLSATRNKFHPVRDLLNSLKWDGVERVDNLFPVFLGAEKSEYTSSVTRLLFAGAIMRVFEPGCKFDTCVVLADTKQGTGKSTICRFLALKDEWFSDEIENMDNKKDSFESMAGKWIVELAEMIATKRTREIETIKAFITRKTDSYRTPYGIVSRDYKRQAIFIGTTNKPEFLPPDKTGNRRFLPILLDGDKAERHPLDDEEYTRNYILQCYAEMMCLMRTQGTLSLTIPKSIISQVRELQEQGSPEDSRVGMIQEWLDNTQENAVCSRMIWDNVFSDADHPIQPKKIDLHDISEIMSLKIEGWTRYQGMSDKTKDARKRFDAYGKQRAWVRDNQWDNQRDKEGFSPIKKDEDIPFM